MGNNQVKAFQDLTFWRNGLIMFAGGLSGVALFGPWDTENLIVLGIAALIVAVAYFCAVVCHELYEINDQLAGRSPELQEWLGKR